MNRSLSWLGVIPLTLLLAACGGGGGSGSASAPANTDGGSNANNGGNTPVDDTYSIGGTVSGLPDGTQLFLLDNGSGAQTISTNGPFTLSATAPTGTPYSISLAAQLPGYQCEVTQGSGTVAASNITDVAIACRQITAAVGGSIDGLTSNSLVLANGKDTLTVPVNSTTFTMPTAVASGAAYDVIVKRSPATMRCTVSNGAGVGGDTPVTNISVACGPATLSTLYSFDDSSMGYTPTEGLILGSDGNFYATTPGGGANDAGEVVKITPTGEVTVCWSFGSGTDGTDPEGSMVEGTDGNFYGTTYSGGAYGAGTVFRITPSCDETVLYSFGVNATDGQGPSGRLLQANDGSFYGLTEEGGTAQSGVVFRVTPSGAETVMASFDGEGGLWGAWHNGLIQARDGNFYGLTGNGGSNGTGTIFKMTPDGTLLLLWSFVWTNGAFPVGSLLEASDGNFYGVTSSGYWGNLFRMTPSGEVSTLHVFGGDGDGASPNGGLIQAADGNLYGVTCNEAGTLFRFNLSGAESVLYRFPDTDRPLICPTGTLAEGADGGLYGVAWGAGNGGTLFQIN